VLACARRSSPGLAGLAGLQSEVQVLALDVADHGQIGQLATTLRDVAIDVLINNAGTMGKSAFGAGAAEDQRFGATDYDDWERIFRTNVAGPMKMAEAFVDHVARSRQKKLVTLSSMVGSMTLNTTGGLYGYRASKAAVNAIVKSMSIDLAERGILAVALHPGWVRTELGGEKAPLDVATSAAGLRRVIATLDRESLGRLIAYDGQVLPY
jgi:NAD(P)-dependent dehydrogenase (short-subunit alcohol dehydrogenase family)